MNKILIIIIIFLTSFLFLSLYKLKKIEKYNSKELKETDPCSDNLSDYEYLTHMIPHHQVAVDISLLLQKKSTNPAMQSILRQLIWIQNFH